MLGSAAPHVTLEGQEHLTVRADLMLYGDNTEFRNPFREGETIFGAAVRPALEIGVNRRVTVTLGALTNQRFGGEDAFELVRPVVAVTFHGPRSTFLIGTLPLRSGLPDGPDRSGPHGRRLSGNARVEAMLAAARLSTRPARLAATVAGPPRRLVVTVRLPGLGEHWLSVPLG